MLRQVPPSPAPRNLGPAPPHALAPTPTAVTLPRLRTILGMTGVASRSPIEYRSICGRSLSSLHSLADRTPFIPSAKPGPHMCSQPRACRAPRQASRPDRQEHRWRPTLAPRPSWLCGCTFTTGAGRECPSTCALESASPPAPPTSSSTSAAPPSPASSPSPATSAATVWSSPSSPTKAFTSTSTSRLPASLPEQYLAQQRNQWHPQAFLPTAPAELTVFVEVQSYSSPGVVGAEEDRDEVGAALPVSVR